MFVSVLGHPLVSANLKVACEEEKTIENGLDFDFPVPCEKKDCGDKTALDTTADRKGLGVKAVVAVFCEDSERCLVNPFEHRVDLKLPAVDSDSTYYDYSLQVDTFHEVGYQCCVI